MTIAKRCQCSDWAARPLYPEQIHYAALDALFPLAAAALALKLPRDGSGLLQLPEQVVKTLAVSPTIAAEFEAAWAATVDWLRPQALRNRALSGSNKENGQPNGK
jgi:ribonuclease D